MNVIIQTLIKSFIKNRCQSWSTKISISCAEKRRGWRHNSILFLSISFFKNFLFSIRFPARRSAVDGAYIDVHTYTYTCVRVCVCVCVCVCICAFSLNLLINDSIDLINTCRQWKLFLEATASYTTCDACSLNLLIN